ncbi:MAG: hypothetical protein QNI98_12945 [Woeseiaceae bacterium]|nr:hypothetical protein [Woeseiaceae bacterium]
MKSRAELLAEIEEKRLEDNRLDYEVNALSIEEADAENGYNPYDHPGRRKELPDGADITLRRRAIMRRKSRR